jgi:hypothetical protein
MKTLPSKEFYQTITKQFARIDHLHQSGGYDSLESENQKIESILSGYKTQLFNFPDSLDYDLIYLTRPNLLTEILCWFLGTQEQAGL